MRHLIVVGLFSALVVMATQPVLAGHVTIKDTPHDKEAQVLGEGLRLYSNLADLKNQASISQRGNGNAAAVGQHGTGDAAAIFQNGKGNAGAVTQNGNNDGFALFQFGKNNGGTYTQNGNGQVGVVLQAGW
jgi:hypothetical protein